MAARTLSLILGLWEFFSAFAFPRLPAGMRNAWIVGLLSAVLAVVSMNVARARYAQTALSAWLLASAFVIPHRTPLSFWNDAAVAVLLFALSLVPGTMYLPERKHAPA